MLDFLPLQHTLATQREVDPRNAAEHAYALAALHLRAGNTQEATRFGREAIALFDECPMRTRRECAPRNTSIGGITMPSSFIHQRVVRDRLKHLAI